MKKIISILLITLMLLYLVSCAELTNVEAQEVDAIVINVYYTQIRHQKIYQITFAYKNIIIRVDNKGIYDCYKDKIGETAKCILITKYYDDGTIAQTLKLKENNK